MNVLIVYYSTYGNVYHMATLVAEGVKEIPGAQPAWSAPCQNSSHSP